MKKTAIILAVLLVLAVSLIVVFFPTPTRMSEVSFQPTAIDSAPPVIVSLGGPSVADAAADSTMPMNSDVQEATSAPTDTNAPEEIGASANAVQTQTSPAATTLAQTPNPAATPEPTSEPTPAATPEPTVDVPRPTATPKPSFEPATEPVIDASETDKAVVILRYYNTNGKRVKVRLSRGGKTYTYDIQPDNTPTRFPLNLGMGDYKVEFLENISGKQYRSFYTGSFSAEWEGKYTPFLQSVQNITWDPSMEPIVAAMRLAISAGETGKIQAIYEELARTLYYDFDVFEKQSLPVGYLPNIEHTYETKLGICYDMSSLLAGMLRSAGVPVKLMMGYSDNVHGYHAWNEVLVDDSWVIVDLTVDSIFREDGKDYSMSKKESEYSPDKEY